MRCHLVWLSAIFAAVLFSQQSPTFEVASVKLSSDGGGGKSASRGSKGGGFRNPTLFSFHSATLKTLILRAYGLQDYQLSGGPGWIENDRYDIDARPERPETPEQMLLMLRSLLVDRFQLRIHRETKTQATYVLTIAKGGPKFGAYFQRLKAGAAFPPTEGRMQLGGDIKNFVFLLRANMRMFDPATGPVASGIDIPPILDHTGLTGAYSILVSYDTHEEWPAILEHQLGLKLNLRKELIEVLIVDHAIKPSEN